MTTKRRPDLEPEIEQMLAILDEGFPDVSQFSAVEVREKIFARAQPPTRQPDMQIARDVSIDGPGGQIPLRIYVPHGEKQRPVVLYAHGGGFVFCGLDSHDNLCREIAHEVDAVVVAVDYRLAPEHLAPAALEDTYRALEWVAGNIAEYGGDPTRIATAGDSAGGNLATTVALAARDRNGPKLVGQVLIYPMIDDDYETESYRKYAEGYYNDKTSMQWYWDQYAPTPEHRDSPYVIPTKADDLSGLPPAIVITAELDTPSDSGVAYARKLEAAGVKVDEKQYEQLFHGFLSFPQLERSAKARADMWQKMRNLFAAAS